MLKDRILTACIGIPILILLLYFGSMPLLIAITIVLLLGIREFINIIENIGLNPIKKSMYVCGLIILLETYIFRGEQAMLAIFIVFLILTLSILFKKYSLAAFSISFIGIIYMGLIKYVLLLRDLPDGLVYIIFTFILTWVVDTGAYFTGRRFGKRKLAPTISPKKTIEGSLGGFSLTILIAVLLDYFFIHIGTLNAVIIGTLIGISAQLGDLFESYLKRSANIKDSGQLLPGHGGVLDRFDSILFTVPITYYFIKIFM